MPLSVAQVIELLDELAATAQKLATAEPIFVAQVIAVVEAAKAILPASTVSGLVNGLKSDVAKVQAFFKKK